MALSAIACDIKDTQHEQNTYGPYVRVLGTSIDPVTAEVPSDGVIQISFDRYLLPSTTNRQGFVIGDNMNRALPPEGLKTIYDPVARTITIVGQFGPGVEWLTPGLEYKLLLQVPPNETTDQIGFRAIDRSPLDPAQNRQFVFRAGAPKKVTAIDPAVDFCSDVMPIFQAKCGDGTCHGAPSAETKSRAAASLVLNTHDGVRVTAKDRVAQGANTGGRSFAPSADGPVFGVDMAIIKPGSPGSSWLMYKIEMAPHPVVDAGPEPTILCTPPPGTEPVKPLAPPYASLAPIVPRASDAERERLASYMLGREMPYPNYQPLDFEERERIRIWIANGAETRECGVCATVDPP